MVGAMQASSKPTTQGCASRHMSPILRHPLMELAPGRLPAMSALRSLGTVTVAKWSLRASAADILAPLPGAVGCAPGVVGGSGIGGSRPGQAAAAELEPARGPLATALGDEAAAQGTLVRMS